MAFVLISISCFIRHTGHVVNCVCLQMLSCLEYMYHDLGLVKEFNINPITLKRWLVKCDFLHI